MEILTIEEFHALLDQHEDAMRFEDFLHARTRQGFAGGRIEDAMILKPRRPLVLGSDGKPISTEPSFDDVCRVLMAAAPK